MDEAPGDEREDVQKKTFAKWMNSQLRGRDGPPITDLFFDLRDGTRLLTLLEVLTGKKYKREKGDMRVHHLNNVSKAMKILEEENVKLVNISSEYIVDGSPKLTLGLVWSIIIHWQVQGVLKEVMSSMQQTNLEKTLLSWCRQSTDGYFKVDVQNFTSSWRDGLAFCAVIHRYRPDLFDWPVMAKKHPYARLTNIFRIAEEQFGIERLLDPEDVNTQNPDKKSIMMYVICLFQSLPHSSKPIEGLNDSSSSHETLSIAELNDCTDTHSSLSVMSIELRRYQQALEEVLTWVLEAEDRLASMPPIANIFTAVKDQFHELEELMIELTMRQGNIGDVLSEGTSFLRDQTVENERAEEMRTQMKLLNTQWEELRIKAMDRQASLHDQLMRLQQEELDNLKQWLTATEDRIANMSDVGPSFADVESQIGSHLSLQGDLQVEQEKINSLSNMVVVVDESNSDATSSSLEDDLNALGERWSHICKWSEQKWSVLQSVHTLWVEYNSEVDKCKNWLQSKGKSLKELEGNPNLDKEELIEQGILLQEMKAEIECQITSHNDLHNAVASIRIKLTSPSECPQDFDSQLEELQDSLDCIISIMEAQNQRLLSFGVDVEELIEKSQESSVNTRELDGNSISGTSPKRQKIYSKTKENFLKEFTVFCEMTSTLISRVTLEDHQKLSLDEMKELREEIEIEMETQKDFYLSLLALGEEAKTEAGAEFAVEIEVKLTSVKSRWSSLQKLFNYLESRIEFMEKMTIINPQIKEIRRSISDLEKFINKIQATTDFDSTIVSHQIQQCQGSKNRILANEENLDKLVKSLNDLPSACSQDKEGVVRTIESLQSDFTNVNMRICNWELMLNDQLKSFEIIDESNNDLSERIEELFEWVNKVDEQLKNFSTFFLTSKMENNLKMLKTTLISVDAEREKLNSMNETLRQLKEEPLTDKVNELNEKWGLVIQALNQKVTEMEQGFALLNQFEEESSGFRIWLDEVEKFVEVDYTSSVNLDSEHIQAELEQSDALLNDIENLRINLNNLQTRGEIFLAKGDSELQQFVTQLLQELNTRWDNAVRKANTQNSSLRVALEENLKENKPIDSLSEDSDDVELYLNKVSSMVSRILSLLKEVSVQLNYTEVVSTAQEFEQNVCLLEPDVATLISKGDTLILKTHISDVSQANKITLSVSNLRKCWSDLKERSETLKNEACNSQEQFKNSLSAAQDLLKWLDGVSEMLDHANNDEKQIKELEDEVEIKKEEIDSLKSTGLLMERYGYEELHPVLTLILIRWSEITHRLSSFQKEGMNQKSIDGDIETENKNERLAVVPDFVAKVNRIREEISTIRRRLHTKAFKGKKYENLMSKEDFLKVIKNEIDRLKPEVDKVEVERMKVMQGVGQQQEDQVRRTVDKLREEWAQINRSYNEEHESWCRCYENWRSLHRTIEDFCLWLNGTEDKLKESADQEGIEAKITQKELEKQVTLKHRPCQSLQNLVKEISEELPLDDSMRLGDKVNALLGRWKAILYELAKRRERVTNDGSSRSVREKLLIDITSWIEKASILTSLRVNITDEREFSEHVSSVNDHLSQGENKYRSLRRIRNSKSSHIPISSLEELILKFDKAKKDLGDYNERVQTKLNVLQSLIVDSEELYLWAEAISVECALKNISSEELSQYKKEFADKSSVYETLDNTYCALAEDAETKDLAVSPSIKSRMNTLESRLKTLESQFSIVPLLDTSKASTISTDDAMVTTSSIFDSSSEKVVDKSLDEIKDAPEFPSTFASSSVECSSSSSPTLILAALDKSILQIRDWLTVMVQMSQPNTPVIGDEENITKLLGKHRNVLRELESKKPQLDDLVTTAENLKDGTPKTEFHERVTKLREHWDETNSSILARKLQLDAMLNDTRKYDSKRIELESWLSRMEARLEKMNQSGRAPNIIDQQIREQKAFQTEVLQYKHNFELFTQSSNRLLTIYQNEDTRRLKFSSDSLYQRFVALNSNVISRGKALYGAINSMQNLRRALDQFIAWLSDKESMLLTIEAGIPVNAGPIKEPSPGAQNAQIMFKDLQSEIKSHQDVLASLNATGQKLLGTIENQEEAMLLHRRLGEMNHRWNTLKFKSLAIRNRLEGTAENWNSLLLSLRELIEWVIRKETELNTMPPLVGELGALAKSEIDLVSFRKSLEEKRPVIESNLKSGRQLIASDPSLNDTSDTEASRDMEGDSRYRGEENARDLMRAVRREVGKLHEKWNNLWERSTALVTQSSLAHKKLGVLLKTVDEVNSRLSAAEREIAGWPQVILDDQNVSEQQINIIKKFRETLPDLLHGIDDVNDQVARFSTQKVPLSHPSSVLIQELNDRWKSLEANVNERWRMVAGRSMGIPPLTSTQLAMSVSPPWERAAAANKVPYYINHDQETTSWDHPQMMELLDTLSHYNHIKFSAYRTASKLRALQKKLSLHRANLQLVADVFDEHGLRGQNDRLIDLGDMVVVLSTLYGRIASEDPELDTRLATDLCLNWLLNVYDSQRTGQMRVLSFRIGLVCLSNGQLEEKYRYLFRLIADHNRLVDQRKLGLLLHDCVQVPRQLGEVAAFGGSNIEPSVRSCFTKAGKDKETIEAVHFLSWLQQEPQSIVWLAVLHRVAASENVQHQVKCNICKTYPIVGLRYRCLKCLSFDMCQRCFFEGRGTKNHKITHPMHEYCTATRAGDEVKDFTKALKNKFKSKRALQKHTKKGYLPVQSVLEGDALESPCPSPSHNAPSNDMHSRLEVYATRLAEVELRTNSNSTPESEDEHALIAQYCQSLESSDMPFPVPKSPLQIMASTDADQKEELEQMIRDLEDENQALQAEYERLKLEQPYGTSLENGLGQRSEAEMLAEAKLLREHKGRLEARMNILEDHNKQLEAQLQRLRQLLMEQTGVNSPNKSNTLQTKSVTASQLATDSPTKINGHTNKGDLERAVGSLVDSMILERENGLHSDENDYDNTSIKPGRKVYNSSSNSK